MMSSDSESQVKIGVIEGKTTPFGFTINLSAPITRTAFLSTEHEEKTYILTVQNLWNDKKGSFAQVRVVGQVPNTAFNFNCEIHHASEDQIRSALGMNVSPEKAIFLGKILNSDIDATPDIEQLGRVFITGKSGSGKSYTVGVLIEELLKKQIPIVIIDRHGEYSALKILDKENVPEDDPFFSDPNHVEGFNQNIIEFADQEMNPGADLGLEYLAACNPPDLVASGQCIIINLRGLDIPVQENIVNQQLMNLYKASTLRQIPPFFLFIDEAHLFAGKKTSPVVETIRLFAQEGRKFGANLVVITQKPQALDVTIRAQAGTWIIHKLTDINDVKITIGSAEGLSADSDEEIQSLNPGEAIIVGDIAPLAPLRVKIRKRYTVHGGAGYNIMDYINNGKTMRKAALVDQILQRIDPNQLPAIKDQSIGTGANLIQALNFPNSSQSQIYVADSEAETKLQEEMDNLRNENAELNAKIQTLELNISGAEVDVLNWKEKFIAEQKRADESLQVAEKALDKLKHQKK
jgi:hypothetical protein